MGDFWIRLRRSKLVQWAAAYVAAAFAFIQVLDVVVQRFGWPDLVEKLLILALAVGFLIALVVAWYHGERGVQRVGGTELILIALLLALGGGALWAYARAQRVTAVAGVPSRTSTAPAVAAPPALAAAPAAGIAAPDVPEKSVAVLPFANESGEPDQQYFSDGLSDDLINALSQFGGLKVISRNSAFQFRDSRDTSATIGKLLGVAHLLEGSVQRAGGEVRVTATLVNASDGVIVWSQRYDKPYKDLFALQDAITHSVAGALKAKLLAAPGAVLQSDRPPGGNLAAYTAYQQGNAYYALGTQAGMRRAIAAYMDATRSDPRYAAAYARWSMASMSLAVQFLDDPAKVASAASAARSASATALQLDPDSAVAHEARAALLQYFDMDWSGSEAESRRALQLAPNDAGIQFGLGNSLATVGQNRRAAALTRRALAGDPRHHDWYAWLGTYFAALGQLDAAQQAIDTAIALQPRAATSHEQLAIIEILRRDAKAALAAARAEPPGLWHDVALALALQIGPDRAAADTALAKLVTRSAASVPYQIAEAYALRRDPDAVFRWLDRALAHRDPGISLLLSDPVILRYRNDPRFAAFCRKVGLPTMTDAVAMK